MPELEDAVAEEVLEDDAIEDVEDVEDVETESTVKKDSTRKRLHEDNVYLFTDNEKAATSLSKLKYEDDSPVEGFRVFGFANLKKDEKLERGEDQILTNATNFIVARTTDLAASYLMDFLGWKGGPYKTKKRGSSSGRAKTIVLASMLEYGKLLSIGAYENCVMPEGGQNALVSTPISIDDLIIENESNHKNFQAWFAPGKNYGHYREDNGHWKLSTKKDA